jgi:hypothetical protein
LFEDLERIFGLIDKVKKIYKQVLRCKRPFLHAMLDTQGNENSCDWSRLIPMTMSTRRKALMKDRLQRSQKVILVQGDISPSQEMSVCTWETSPPSGNTKKAIKPTFQPDPWDHIYIFYKKRGSV